MEDDYIPSPQAREIERRARELIADAAQMQVRLRIDTAVVAPFAIGNTRALVEAWDVLPRHRPVVAVNLSEDFGSLEQKEKLCKTS